MSECKDCGGEAISDYTLCEACATERRDAVYEKYSDIEDYGSEDIDDRAGECISDLDDDEELMW